MPELPEVETTVLDLKKKVLGRTFIDGAAERYQGFFSTFSS